MTDQILVLINKKSGRAGEEGVDAIEAKLRPILKQRGEPVFIADEVPRLMERARAQSGGHIVTVGGDGTIAALASCLYGREEQPVFIPLPYGTANLIPRDLGMPLEPDEALRASLRAQTRRIDFVDAGGTALLHSAAFGSFAEMAEERETIRSAPTFGDALDAAQSMFGHFFGTVAEPYRLTIDGVEKEVDSAAIFLANNRVTGRHGGYPARERLDRGELALYISKTRGVGGLLSHIIDAMSGQFDESPEFDRYLAREVTVESLAPEMHYTIDGEPGKSRERITFTMHHDCLMVPDLR